MKVNSFQDREYVISGQVFNQCMLGQVFIPVIDLVMHSEFNQELPRVFGQALDQVFGQAIN